MNKVPVTSAILSTIAYDLGNSDLLVEFINGSTYKYRKVPVRVFNALLLAQGQKSAGFPNVSVGSKFAKLVKKAGLYDFERL